MSPRTIAISLGLHVVLGAALLAIDGDPRKRIATVIEVFEAPTKKPEPPPPEPETPLEPEKPPEPPKPEPPKPEPKPKLEPKPKPRRTPKRASTPKSDASRKAAPYFSGLVLGNADGPGIAVGVAQDVDRRARDGAGASAGVASGKNGAPRPTAVEPPKPRAARPRCTDIVRPKVLERRRPIAYADAARTEGAEGRMLMRLHVSAVGAVERVDVTRSVHPALDREAIAAVRTWRFAPERRCGRAVPSTYVLARRFELTD